MKKTPHKNLQRQIGNLIPIIELCLPFIEEINQTQNKLNLLPTELEYLKQQAEWLAIESSPITSTSASSHNLELNIKETEFQLDSLVDDLEYILVHLNFLEQKLKNLLVLKERLEAVQEERIDGITPERIYKLLEKQRQQKCNRSFPPPKKPAKFRT